MIFCVCFVAWYIAASTADRFTGVCLSFTDAPFVVCESQCSGQEVSINCVTLIRLPTP